MNAQSNEQPQNHIRFAALAGIVFFAAGVRAAAPTLLGNHLNFAPVDAIALFSGAYFTRRRWAFLLPLLSVWAGDAFINFAYYGHVVLLYDGWYWQYGAYALIVLLGGLLNGRVRLLPVAAGSVAAAALFFIVSNFGVWASGGLYPHTPAGLIACYAMGLPFFRATLLSDLLYSAILFGAFELAQRKIPALAVRYN